MSSSSQSRDYKFTEFTGNSYSFPSTWKNAKTYNSKPCQTEEIQIKEKETQSSTNDDKSVQVDMEQKEVKVATIGPPYPPSLYAFFTKVTDEVCRCLQENLDPFSVAVFKDSEDAEEVKQISNAVKEFTLHSSSVSPEEFSGSCVAWNKRGTQVSIGYQAHKHSGWCSHRVPVASWNLRQIRNSTETLAHFEVFLPGCVTTLEFHPFHPSIIAAGMHNGGVGILDISIKNPQRDGGRPLNAEKTAREKMDQQMEQLGYFMTKSEHSLPVTAVHWMKLNAAQSAELITKNKTASGFCIVTAGRDGCICLWSTNTSNTRILLEKKFVIWADSIPAEVPVGVTSRSTIKQLGIIGLGTCKDDPFACVLVTHGGHVFQASLDSNVEAYTAMMDLESSASSTERYLDPGLVYVSSYDKLPKSLRCSPYHRDVFLLATSGGKVIIQNMLQPRPMYEFNLGSDKTINDAKWSGRPAMFAVAIDRKVKILDIRRGEDSQLTIRHDQPVTSIAFNDTEIGTLATCDTKGVIHIWNLPRKMSSIEPQEMDALINYPGKRN